LKPAAVLVLIFKAAHLGPLHYPRALQGLQGGSHAPGRDFFKSWEVIDNHENDAMED